MLDSSNWPASQRVESRSKRAGNGTPETTLAAARRETTLRRIQRRAAEIERRECRRALSRLDERGELGPEQRRAIRQIASRLVAELLSPVEEGLETADEPTIEAALDLFGEEP